MGLTREGIASDIGMMYGDWGDTITYMGSPIEGFVSIEEFYDGNGETVATTKARVLHTPKFLTKGSAVTVNGREYEIESREQTETAFRYRLNK